MTALPDDRELLKMAQRGMTHEEIGNLYGVTKQAVNKRLRALGYSSKPIARAVAELLPWDVEKEHRKALRYVNLRYWMRMQLGDEEVPAVRQRDGRNYAYLLAVKEVVLDYDAATGWSEVPRQPSDGRLAIRWPADAPEPSEEARKALELPEV
ncbi:hypothetical protein DR950_36185 [Kitasatospora xanthocidica]|uniref:Uncharacterized protein n=1 Tax=Kitasatospora xanthocidica TaxID=83382 RepID=A0A373A2U0_9ACTN|nr:hypothetical protein [Kitasatospora xanthocidica]RGD62473.1 hypothetical protein DR950_36185 [Kitasatospora xanthocidica]